MNKWMLKLSSRFHVIICVLKCKDIIILHTSHNSMTTTLDTIATIKQTHRSGLTVSAASGIISDLPLHEERRPVFQLTTTGNWTIAPVQIDAQNPSTREGNVRQGDEEEEVYRAAGRDGGSTEEGLTEREGAHGENGGPPQLSRESSPGRGRGTRCPAS